MSNATVSLTVRLEKEDMEAALQTAVVNDVPRVGDTISFELRDPVTDELTGQVVLYKVVTVTWNFQSYPAALCIAEHVDADASDILGFGLVN